ncbi:MAG: hypothetical protein DRH57_03775 [Candidatus Cloacimonadota bacterium]|nr:MAG: hypothetical protein DRH57_03775 [Candidatus Cloacimonadota bacterium]
MPKEKEETPSFIEKFNKMSNTVVAIYGLVALLATSSITGYTWYSNVLTSIAENTTQIEITQMMIMKDIVRKAERNPCIVSDAERDDYTENYTTLYNLEIKYGKIGKNAPWQPIARVVVRNDQCTK